MTNFGKRLENKGNISITMIRTDMGLYKSEKKKEECIYRF